MLEKYYTCNMIKVDVCKWYNKTSKYPTSFITNVSIFFLVLDHKQYHIYTCKKKQEKPLPPSFCGNSAKQNF